MCLPYGARHVCQNILNPFHQKPPGITLAVIDAALIRRPPDVVDYQVHQC